MGGSTARALLGGALVAVTLALVAGELAGGSAAASRDQVGKATLDKLHQRRPAAATRNRRRDQSTLALAVDAAVEQDRATAATRASVGRWVTALVANQAQEVARQAAEAQAAEEAAAASSRHTSSGSSGRSSSGGGDTLACIRAHESDTSGGYSAVNSSSGAGGAYQVLPSTWDGYGGYARAEDAPASVQDQWANEALASAGTAPWAGSGC